MNQTRETLQQLAERALASLPDSVEGVMRTLEAATGHRPDYNTLIRSRQCPLTYYFNRVLDRQHGCFSTVGDVYLCVFTRGGWRDPIRLELPPAVRQFAARLNKRDWAGLETPVDRCHRDNPLPEDKRASFFQRARRGGRRGAVV